MLAAMESSCIDSSCTILRATAATSGCDRPECTAVLGQPNCAPHKCKMDAKELPRARHITPRITASASRLALSELAPETLQSEIRAMTTECDRMGGINLAQGVCDTPVPAVVEAAAIEAIRDGQNIYTRCDGIARLREAIAAKQQRDYGLTYDPENEVLVASGATAGLHAAAMALLNPGDEVLRLRAVLRLPRATRSSRCA